MKRKIIQAQEVVSKVEMEAQPEEEVMAEGGGPLDDAVLLTVLHERPLETHRLCRLCSSHLGAQGHQPPVSGSQTLG